MSATQWPSIGRGHRAGNAPTDPQLEAMLFVYRMNCGPLGEGCTRAEIHKRVPLIDGEELADALRANWIKVDHWMILGGGVGALDCWDITADGAAILRKRQAEGVEHKSPEVA